MYAGLSSGGYIYSVDDNYSRARTVVSAVVTPQKNRGLRGLFMYLVPNSTSWGHWAEKGRLKQGFCWSRRYIYEAIVGFIGAVRMYLESHGEPWRTT